MIGYRKRRKVAPWTTFGLSSRSAGISVGPKGAKVSRSSSGRTSLSLGLGGLFGRKRIR